MTEIVGLQKAAGIAKVSRMTMSDWCNRLDLAEFRAGKWRIDPEKLQRIIDARAVLKRVGS